MSSEATRPNLKVVLLGDSGVGKTSLVFRWVTGLFNEKLKPTIGTNHQVKTIIINDQHADIFLWDTAGQEQFHALAPLYVRQSSAVIIVASAISQDSQRNIQSWITMVKDSCDTIPPMILAINKMDLVEDNSALCDSINMEQKKNFPHIFFVSASTGEGVEQLFQEAALEGFNIKMKEVQYQQVELENTKQKNKSGCSC